MARTTNGKAEPNRAAIYARVSDKSQDGEDKTSITEQIGEMEAYCKEKGLTITARYQEVGKGWSKKRPEFQRMLADARRGRFDVIVCWKSDRLSRGMYPAAALMEVIEAYQIRLEAVMDAIDMKTFGLMAAIGKIELDNFRERASMGKRGAAKQGRVPAGKLPFGYRVNDEGKPEVVKSEADLVRRIFHMYVHEGMGAPSIAWQFMDEGIPTPQSGKRWYQAAIHRLLANPTYKGIWSYGQTRQVVTEQGTRVYGQPEETWIDIPVPPIIDEETWDRAQSLKKRRLKRSKRNTKLFYLLQYMLRCAECGMTFGANGTNFTSHRKNGKLYEYHLAIPRRYYSCRGMRNFRLRCREKPYIRADRLEDRVWGEVKHVLQNPHLIVSGIESLDDKGTGGLAEEVAETERELRNVQMEEDRAIRLYVSGKISEAQLDLQRKFIVERLESLRVKLHDYQAREASGAEKRALAETILSWAGKLGEGLDELSPGQRKELLQMIVEEVVIDGDNNLDITLAVPVDDSVAFASPVSFPPPSPRSAVR